MDVGCAWWPCGANLQPGLSAELQLCGLRSLRLHRWISTSRARARLLSFFPEDQRYSLLETMSQKVVLITGCSSGIGLALAARIAKDEKKRFMGKVPER